MTFMDDINFPLGRLSTLMKTVENISFSSSIDEKILKKKIEDSYIFPINCKACTVTPYLQTKLK